MLIRAQWDENNITTAVLIGVVMMRVVMIIQYITQRQKITVKSKPFIAFMGVLWNCIMSD